LCAGSGCCGTSDIRRITDLSYQSSMPCCCCRGTVTVLSGDNTDTQLNITTWHTKTLYNKLKDAWSNAKANVALDVALDS
jgi:cytidine deaminase